MPTRTPGRPSGRAKKPKRPSSPHAVRRSIWITCDLFNEIGLLAKQEERRVSDMIRILIQRGLRASRVGPPPDS